MLPRLLITNDDGIDAPGLAVLTDIAREFAQEIWILAPRHDASGTGQSLSLHHPLRCYPEGERRWSVSGTPADCVAIAVAHFMKQSPPSMILSGINAGSNTGDDVNLSGTLGAAFTGLMLGVPAIAISQAFAASRKDTRWDTARAIAPKLLRHFLKTGWRKDACLSINIPDLPAEKIRGFAWARQGAHTVKGVRIEKREDLREQQYFWMRMHDREPSGEAGAAFDCNVLARGEVAVTALTLDRSVEVNEPAMAFEEMKMKSA